MEENDPQVAAIQTVLQERRLYGGEISGVCDAETVAAIRRFQILHRLRVNGQADAPTLEALRVPVYTPGAAVLAEDARVLWQAGGVELPEIAAIWRR